MSEAIRPGLRDRTQAQKVIESAHELPTLPIVIGKINEVIRNPKTSANDVGHLISQDQVLTAKTLRLVNSAFYGFPRKISNITRAIVILGFQKVKNLALTASVFDAFKRDTNGLFDYVGFWKHSLAVAIMSEILAKRTRIVDGEEAFVGGLIHDIGKMVMAQFLKEELAEVMMYVRKHDVLMVQAEKEILGYHHGLVGEWLAEKWQFPARLCGTIRMHHSPSLAREGKELIYVVHIADVMIRAIDIGSGGDNRVPQASEEAWVALKLNPGVIDKSYQEFLEGFANAQEFLEMIQGK